MAVPVERGAERELELEQIEVELLLEGIYRRYGYDFRHYAPASLKRRLRRRMDGEQVETVSALQEVVLHDPSVMERLLLDLSINVTAMFRDPTFFLSFREKVVPLLRTYPFSRLWVAGCSTGEEVYSFAILLAEEDLAERVRIYATDINQAVVDLARLGVFPLDKMQEYTQNYIRAGGARSFSEYYVARYDGARFSRSLVDGVVFAQHNLASDAAFNEFHAIACRNVMIYFDRPLQEHVHRLFYESLARFGVLALGQKETIRFSPHEDAFEELDGAEKLYRKVR
ncbi:MAG: CheR family methyltransferase [Gaiellaceae bacterium]